MKFKNVCNLCDCHMPCINRNDALDFKLVNMYGFAEPKICYAFGVDVYVALAWCF
jgi:hypothetical protein